MNDIHDRICNYFFDKKYQSDILSRRLVVEHRIKYMNENNGKLPRESCCSKIIRSMNGLSNPFIFDYEAEFNKENDLIKDIVDYFGLVFCPEGFVNQNKYINKSVRNVIKGGTSMTVERGSFRGIKEQEANYKRTSRSRTSLLADDRMRYSKRINLRESISVFDNNPNLINNINTNFVNRSSCGPYMNNNSVAASPVPTGFCGSINISIKLDNPDENIV